MEPHYMYYEQWEGGLEIIYLSICFMTLPYFNIF